MKNSYERPEFEILDFDMDANLCVTSTDFSVDPYPGIDGEETV